MTLNPPSANFPQACSRLAALFVAVAEAADPVADVDPVRDVTNPELVLVGETALVCVATAVMFGAGTASALLCNAPPPQGIFAPSGCVWFGALSK
jgi:hypothetical protein